jgi:Flp pilus assembly protein TadD
LTKATLKELDVAIRLDAGNAGAHRLLGEMLSQIPDVPFVIHGDKQKAVTELETAMKLAPNETANYPALAEGYLAVEDKADAVKTLQKIFAITAPDDPGACEDDLRDARALLGKLGAVGQ